MHKTVKHVLILTAALIGLVAVWPASSSAIGPGAAAQLGALQPAMPPVSTAFSTTTTCAPYALWNPDAGIGMVSCGSGYSTVNAEMTAAQTTAVKFVWRKKAVGTATTAVTTRANLETYGMVRCAGCTNGAAYQAEVTSAITDLFCVTAADAGIVIAVECGR